VVSTPVALVSAIGSAARRGVLIKGGVYLEAAASLSAIAFDKTGTLTTGNPAVTDVIPLCAQDSRSILALAASIERLSEHPLAKAIVTAAHHEQLRLSEVEKFASVTGRGATALVDGQKYIIGSMKFLSDTGLAINQIEDITNRLYSEGKTAVIISDGSELLGIIALADKLRPDSRPVLEKLKHLGLTTFMLTGDNYATAAAIAHEAGIDEFKAELLPENKVAAVKDLLKLHGKVAMLGDGINDAPALATATLGIAMGAAGTDTALETADIALMADDLSGLPFLIHLSKACLKVIKQNVWFSVIIKLIAILLVFPGWLNLWLAILADMGTTILVTLNGLRLHRIKSNI
jgi:Cd2+/Zn2+-exporting ATPase